MDLNTKVLIILELYILVLFLSFIIKEFCFKKYK